MITLDENLARRLRIADGAMLLAAVTGFGLSSFVVGFPTNPEGEGLGTAIEIPGQIAMLGVVVVGWLVSLKWPGVGAVLIAVGGLGLGLLASVEYPPSVAVAVMVLFSVPAVLVWLSWQHRRTHAEVVVLAVVTAAILVTEAVGSTTIYNHYFGPAHPVSPVAAVDADQVEWVWAGDLRPDGATVAVRTMATGKKVSLAVHDGTTGRSSPSTAVTTDGDRVARIRVAGLEANRKYDYVVQVDGRPDRGRGHGTFTTAPPSGAPASFTVAVASCARTASSGKVYDAIRQVDPLLYLISGDLHYANLSGTDPTAFIDAMGRALTAPSQAELYRAVPIDYVWDDHDYGPNDADAASPSRVAARTAYRAAVPHPPLAVDAGPGRGAIHHAFTIGRVRFVVTDTRSERTATSLLGGAQEQWLIGELSRAEQFGAVVWVNPDPWIAPAQPGRDDWGGYADQRRRIADAVAEHEVDNLVMVAGDAHMVAIDDGTNSDYATNGGGGFPLLHAGSLDRPGSLKGGPYSEGAHPGAGQFGVLQIEDDGSTVAVTLQGRDWTDKVLLELSVTLSGPSPSTLST